ncbi:MAG: transglutaminase domain-containing protein [Betaproteobacteria bacterium]|nr:transglutaminase domain-containing protein [Betaproteobacteria bacterium]
MKMHPLMLAAAIAFWGWQTGMWIVAAPVAIALVAAWRLPLRWDLAPAQLYRVADFCTVLAVVLGGYLYVTYGNPRAIILLFQWWPLALLPLALAHAYGTSERMDLRVLFWSLRRNPPRRAAGFDPWFPYYVMWLIAASAANVRDEWFYIGLVALASWPLVRIRPGSYRVGAWGIAFSIAVALGYGLQYGLHEAQLWLEAQVPEWLSGAGSRTDPYRSTTDIGHIGALKQSDTIVLRVAAGDGVGPPRLLHRASYNTYAGASWFARSAKFGAVSSSPRPDNWVLEPAGRPSARIVIHDYSVQRNPVLSLPAGTVTVEKLVAKTMKRNPLGAVQIERDPGFFSYEAAYTAGRAVEGAPAAEDLRIARAEHAAFAALASELGLNEMTPGAAVARVRRYFAEGFQYAAFQESAARNASPIVDFVLRSRAGHCEYFATATALLLRAAGIPARYATGFAVLESSTLENAWVVRERHAHSWVRAHVDGAWIEVDTTPPTWAVIEASASGAWTGVLDIVSWMRFRAAQAWNNSSGQTLLSAAFIVVFPFALWIAWRLYRSRRKINNVAPGQPIMTTPWPGADSELYRIEQRMGELGWGRRVHETAGDWLARLRADAPVDCGALAEIVDLHYRYRFDPRGLSGTQRARLRQAGAAWIASKVS